MTSFTPSESRRIEPTGAARRSARRLSQLVQEALAACPYVPHEGVEVDHCDGEVVLRGRVRSFFQKQMAQETLPRIDGV